MVPFKMTPKTFLSLWCVNGVKSHSEIAFFFFPRPARVNIPKVKMWSLNLILKYHFSEHMTALDICQNELERESGKRWQLFLPKQWEHSIQYSRWSFHHVENCGFTVCLTLVSYQHFFTRVGLCPYDRDCLYTVDSKHFSCRDRSNCM